MPAFPELQSSALGLGENYDMKNDLHWIRPSSAPTVHRSLVVRFVGNPSFVPRMKVLSLGACTVSKKQDAQNSQLILLQHVSEKRNMADNFTPNARPRFPALHAHCDRLEGDNRSGRHWGRARRPTRALSLTVCLAWKLRNAVSSFTSRLIFHSSLKKQESKTVQRGAL